MAEFPDKLTPPPREKTSILQEGQWREELWRYVQAGADLLSGGNVGQFLQSAGPGIAPVWTTGYALIGVTVFTSTGNYLKTTNNPRAVLVRLLGGGGAGGGAPATAAGQVSIGSGGAGGGYAEKWILASLLANSETVTIGAAGVPASGTTGGDGGDTTFGSHFTAGGGSGGNFGTAVAGTRAVSGAVPGIGTGGDLNAAGERSQPGWAVASIPLQMGGNGGGSIFGGGGGGAITTTGQGTGGAATGYGAGGGGATNGTTGNSAVSGGAGKAGVAIIWEFA